VRVHYMSMPTRSTITPTELNDPSLIQGMVRGEEDCLAALYDRHAPCLLALGRRVLRNAQEAEDVVHDVFMEAWSKAHTFQSGRATVRGWLLLRMRSRCLDRLRAATVRRDAPDDAPPRPRGYGSADQILIGPDARRVRAAVHELPPAQRDVLSLLYFKGLSSSEVAASLGCPVGTVKSRARLAMRRLREQLIITAPGTT
jgi:RNA polymerase sigma-70 factor (ECF subfamily)